MTERERLIELVAEALDSRSERLSNGCYLETNERIADYLLANGVTVPVRCSECFFSRKVDDREPKYQCVNICRDGCSQWLGSDDYCSYGERRADNG